MQNVANIEELENKQISRLLWQYALPAIVGTMVNSLYNVIDRIFIGLWVGDDAISALGLVLPIMNITAAVGMLVGAGSASRISIFLGKKDIVTAEKIAGTSFVMTLILSGIVILGLLLFLDPVLRYAGASDVTLPYARDFLVIFLPGNLFLSLCFNFNNMMRASGYPKKAMITMLISVVTNIILAPIFIHYLGWGIKGAATATFIAMVVGFIFVMQHFMNPRSFIKLRVKNLRLSKKIVWSITSIGMSPFFMQLAASAVIFFIIFQLRKAAGDDTHAGDMAIGAYTIANTLLMLIVMVVIGLTQGMQPIVGYNYGAKNYIRVKDTVVYTIKIGMAITTFGFILGFFFPHIFVSFFNPGPILAEDSVNALRILIICFPLVGFQLVVTNFFQCIGQAGKSILLSLTRQVLFLVPALFIMPQYFGLNGVWMSIPIADSLATVTTLILFVMQVRILKREEALHSDTI
ncbi:MATE family efflux transporter [Dysgonomonas macrotermitis]|uniref:Multidrug export protein MepA n=1 Tax=Dysgonomonas macrotermitis TaxID=1346286 RepID=A0A1M5HUE1_9BACT|nr:MATE family efflux transporter [Dysgonomonas macrotermitis]SHG19523.1 putative efflux protein, MATE family [Dysgonomonas macrotermitis]